MSSFSGTMVIFFIGMGVSIWHLAVLFKGSAKWKNKDPYDPSV